MLLKSPTYVGYDVLDSAHDQSICKDRNSCFSGLKPWNYLFIAIRPLHVIINEYEKSFQSLEFGLETPSSTHSGL